jgi:lipase chaperone LimK
MATMMKLKPSLLWSGLLLAGLAVLGTVLLRPASAPQAPAAELPRADPFAFVRSMEGTKPDGNLKVAANSGLVVDAELGHLFDYYLSALGEKSLEAIRVETERELDRKLSPQAAQEAKRLLGRYLDYKRDLIEVEKNLKPGGSQAEMIRARLQGLQQTRAKFFSATESSGLFALSDLRDQDALARIEVSENKTLNPGQKKEQLARLDAQLPQPLREEREAPLKVQKMEEAVAQLRAKGGSDQDVYQLRAKTFSPEAAARLAEVDREEAQWQARIAVYLAARKQVIQATPNPAQQAAAILGLRQQYFSAEEQLRLPAYEQG